MIPPAVSRSHCTPSCPIRFFSATGIVRLSAFVNIIAKVYSFHDCIKMYTPVATRQGASSGRIMRVNALPRLHPSMSADSYSDSGRSFKNPIRRQTEKGIVNVV